MRIRVRFTKAGKIRWTSHRDVARIWERAIRRVRLPVAYSQGFSPHPKIHFGLALTTGHQSDAEFLDIDLDDDSPQVPLSPDRLAELVGSLTDALPVGMAVTAVAEIDTRSDSLQQAVQSCEWLVEIRGATPPATAEAISGAMAATELMLTRTRKGKDVTDDVRPYLLELFVVGPTDTGTDIFAHLATQPRGLRIGELIAVLGAGGHEGRVRRTIQWTQRDGARREPLEGPLLATAAPHAETHAS